MKSFCNGGPHKSRHGLWYCSALDLLRPLALQKDPCVGCCVWDSTTGSHLLTYGLPSRENFFDGVRTNALAWSPDSSRIAFASWDGTVAVVRVQ